MTVSDRFRIVWCFSLALAGTPALADEAALKRCRAIADNTARLACYDAIGTARATPPATPVAPVATPAAPTAPAASTPPAAPRVEAVWTAPPPAPSNNAAAKPVEQFGLEHKVTETGPAFIESHIPGAFEGWGPRTLIRLANGQVWQIADDTSRFLSFTDPKVRIRRGVFGAFYLEFEQSNHSPRVKRVQ